MVRTTCNAIIEDADGERLLSLANPDGMLTPGTLGSNPTMQEIAREANMRIERIASLIEYQT